MRVDITAESSKSKYGATHRADMPAVPRIGDDVLFHKKHRMKGGKVSGVSWIVMESGEVMADILVEAEE